MKSKDIGLVVVVGIFASVFAAIVSTQFLAAPSNLQHEVEVAQPISTEFTLPDERYFNKDSINPTRLIQIGENENQNPFNKR
jgi:hypothetical protein